MKLTKATLAIALLAGLASCTETTTTQTATGDTTMNANTPMQTTTTTTTTTKTPVMFMPKENVEYVNLKTGKKVKVRVDTIHHYIVDVTNNQPVDWIMEPGTTDTVYGRNMRVANHAIHYNSGTDWSYDESMSNMNNGGGADNMSGNGQNMNSGNMDNGNMSNGAANNSGNMAPDNGNMSSGDGNSKTKVKVSDHGNKVKVKTK